MLTTFKPPFDLKASALFEITADGSLHYTNHRFAVRLLPDAVTNAPAPGFYEVKAVIKSASGWETVYSPSDKKAPDLDRCYSKEYAKVREFGGEIHDFLWRLALATPEAGKISGFDPAFVKAVDQFISITEAGYGDGGCTYPLILKGVRGDAAIMPRSR
jgi:hypothetical protein